MMQKIIFVLFLFICSVGLVGCLPTPDVVTPSPAVMPSVQASTPTSAVTPEASPTLAPVENPVTELNIPNRIDNPLMDQNQIIAILEKLKAQFLVQFSKVGWYYMPTFEGSENYLLHISQPGSGYFDQFLWLRKSSVYAPGFVYPAFLVFPDGSWGWTQMSPEHDNFSFVYGGAKTEQPTTFDNLDYFVGNGSGGFGNTVLDYYINLVKNPDETGYTTIHRTFSGWVDTYQGEPVFVLLNKETYPGHKNQLESSLETINSDDELIYFNLANGGCINEKYTWYLENGTQKDDELQVDLNQIIYYETLPSDLQAIYDQIAEQRRQYLAGQ